MAGSDIPGARQRLRQIANMLQFREPDLAAGIRDVIETQLYKSTPVKIVKSRVRHLDDGDRERVRQMRRANMSMSDIAHKFGVNVGRISEILNEGQADV